MVLEEAEQVVVLSQRIPLIGSLVGSKLCPIKQYLGCVL